MLCEGWPASRRVIPPNGAWKLRKEVDGSDRYPVTIENLDEEAINRTVDEAYRAKYADEGEALRQMVLPQARAYTMRITLQ